MSYNPPVTSLASLMNEVIVAGAILWDQDVEAGRRNWTMKQWVSAVCEPLLQGNTDAQVRAALENVGIPSATFKFISDAASEAL